MTTGNAFLSSSVSLLYLDESYSWLQAVIMGIQNRASSRALFSDLIFNILSHAYFFCYWNARFGFPFFLFIFLLIIMTKQLQRNFDMWVWLQLVVICLQNILKSTNITGNGKSKHFCFCTRCSPFHRVSNFFPNLLRVSPSLPSWWREVRTKCFGTDCFQCRFGPPPPLIWCVTLLLCGMCLTVDSSHRSVKLVSFCTLLWLVKFLSFRLPLPLFLSLITHLFSLHLK